MRSLEIVVHCYSEALPIYAKMLTAQLSSMILWPPNNCNVLVTVCGTPSDKLTFFVVNKFSERFTIRHPVAIRWLPFEKKSLFRRAIGRNAVFKETTADVVWAADCDYLCGEGALDAIANVDWEAIRPHELVFPGHYLNCNSHAEGDAEIERITAGEVFTPYLAPYHRKRLRLGIGGLQIVPQRVARRGYLDATKWCQPRVDETPFPDTDDDARYRRTICSSVPIVVPELRRLRHTETSYEDAASRKLRMNKKPKPGRG